MNVNEAQALTPFRLDADHGAHHHPQRQINQSHSYKPIRVDIHRSPQRLGIGAPAPFGMTAQQHVKHGVNHDCATSLDIFFIKYSTVSCSVSKVRVFSLMPSINQIVSFTWNPGSS